MNVTQVLYIGRLSVYCVYMYNNIKALDSITIHPPTHTLSHTQHTHTLQLQFSLAIIHAIHSLYIDCNFPKWMHYTLIGYAFSFICLFTNFYIQTYIKKGRRKRGRREEQPSKAREALANGSAAVNGVEGKKEQ